MIAATFPAIFDNGGLLQLLLRKSGPVFHAKLLPQMWHEIGSRLVIVSFLAFLKFSCIFFIQPSADIFFVRFKFLNKILRFEERRNNVKANLRLDLRNSPHLHHWYNCINN